VVAESFLLLPSMVKMVTFFLSFSISNFFGDLVRTPLSSAASSQVLASFPFLFLLLGPFDFFISFSPDHSSGVPI